MHELVSLKENLHWIPVIRDKNQNGEFHNLIIGVITSKSVDERHFKLNSVVDNKSIGGLNG